MRLATHRFIVPISAAIVASGLMSAIPAIAVQHDSGMSSARPGSPPTEVT